MSARQATADDIESISNLLVSFSAEYLLNQISLESSRAGVAHLISNPYLGRYYVFESMSTIIAYAMVFFEWSDWRAGNIYYIEAAYTLPPNRKSGVFKQIFNQIYKDAESENSALRVITPSSFPVDILAKLGLSESHYIIFETKFQ